MYISLGDRPRTGHSSEKPDDEFDKSINKEKIRTFSHGQPYPLHGLKAPGLPMGGRLSLTSNGSAILTRCVPQNINAAKNNEVWSSQQPDVILLSRSQYHQNIIDIPSWLFWARIRGVRKTSTQRLRLVCCVVAQKWSTALGSNIDEVLIEYGSY